MDANHILQRINTTVKQYYGTPGAVEIGGPVKELHLNNADSSELRIFLLEQEQLPAEVATMDLALQFPQYGLQSIKIIEGKMPISCLICETGNGVLIPGPTSFFPPEEEVAQHFTYEHPDLKEGAEKLLKEIKQPFVFVPRIRARATNDGQYEISLKYNGRQTVFSLDGTEVVGHNAKAPSLTSALYQLAALVEAAENENNLYNKEQEMKTKQFNFSEDEQAIVRAVRDFGEKVFMDNDGHGMSEAEVKTWAREWVLGYRMIKAAGGK